MKPLINTLYLCVILSVSHSSLALADKWHPEVKTIRVNNYEMSYVERGRGTPLILVHGTLSDYRTWLPLLNEFGESNRTIAVSLRHYYPEQWNGKGTDLSLQQHADDLAVLIQTLHIGPVILLGHSRGGAVALLMTRRHPELVQKLILADPTPLTTMWATHPDVQATVANRNTKLRKVMDYYQQGDMESGLHVFVNYIAGPTAWKNTSAERRKELRSNGWTLISLLRDINTPFNCRDAGDISAPVLLITGEYSAPLYGYMHSSLQSCLKQSDIATISDAGHMMFHANPTAFVFEVEYFISPN